MSKQTSNKNKFAKPPTNKPTGQSNNYPTHQPPALNPWYFRSSHSFRQFSLAIIVFTFESILSSSITHYEHRHRRQHRHHHHHHPVGAGTGAPAGGGHGRRNGEPKYHSEALLSVTNTFFRAGALSIRAGILSFIYIGPYPVMSLSTCLRHLRTISNFGQMHRLFRAKSLVISGACIFSGKDSLNFGQTQS